MPSAGFEPATPASGGEVSGAPLRSTCCFFTGIPAPRVVGVARATVSHHGPHHSARLGFDSFSWEPPSLGRALPSWFSLRRADGAETELLRQQVEDADRRPVYLLRAQA